MSSQKKLQLIPEQILATILPDGIFSRSLKGFEARKPQQEMMLNVIEALNHNKIALIEAGTGVGKSMAYLVPAMIWASLFKEKILISTNTIALQEQLLTKDIPLIAKVLQLDLKATLVKGMGNYVCLRKLEDSSYQLKLMPQNEMNQLEQILAWSEQTKDGSKSSIPFTPLSQVWEQVSAEYDTCSNTSCPHFQTCFYFQARKEASDAQLLIVNHHLLFADLANRAENQNYQQLAVLPPYNRLIIDEAHHIEETATEYFAESFSRHEIFRIIARLSSEKEQAQGKLSLLKQKLLKLEKWDAESPLIKKLTVDLPGLRSEVLSFLTETFDALERLWFMLHKKTQDGSDENKLRIRNEHTKHPMWQSSLKTVASQYIDAMNRFTNLLEQLAEDVESSENDRLLEQTKGLLQEIKGLAERLSKGGMLLKHFISTEVTSQSVRWIEQTQYRMQPDIMLVEAQLDISKFLYDHLFQKFPTVILCSATLTSHQKFQFFRKQIGLHAEASSQVTENIYDSPFHYPTQALFAIPTDIVSPSDARFISEAIKRIEMILQVSRGNAFILFTSYAMMTACYQLLEKKLKEKRFFPLKQGDKSRMSLLNAFKSQQGSVLFGTDSFWEGVDVVGDALRCVIIVKLPFKVPSEPIIQARTELILEKGGDPFMEYSLPQAVLKFKQGFGRLIRHHKDRGCVVCLDNRLATKGYGKLFLNSLPDCEKLIASSDQIQERMSDFYKKTYYLTKT